MSEEKEVEYCPFCAEGGVAYLGSTKGGEDVYTCSECDAVFTVRRLKKYRIEVIEEEEKE
jgi:transposase-like protein